MRGERHYDTYCSACHGVEGASRVSFPDLRFSPTLGTQRQFDAVVLEGVRSVRGMVSFKQALTPDDSAALRAYVTSRANQLRVQRGSGN